MGNKKSRQDLLGYDLSSDTDDDGEEEEETDTEEKYDEMKSEIESPMITSSPDIMTSSQQYADNLRMFNTTRNKDTEADEDVGDLSR